MQVLEGGLQEVLIFEDDVDFQPSFRENLLVVLDEARRNTPSWDLMYACSTAQQAFVLGKIICCYKGSFLFSDL